MRRFYSKLLAALLVLGVLKGVAHSLQEGG